MEGESKGNKLFHSKLKVTFTVASINEPSLPSYEVL